MSDSSPTAPAKKKVYEPPAVLSREQLEVFAGVCSPTPPAKATPLACPDGPSSS